LLLLAGGSGAWLWQQYRQARAAEAVQRRQEADAAVVQAIREAQLLLRQARSAALGDTGKLRDALAALKAETAARTAEVSADVQQQAEDLTAELEREARAVQRDRRLLAALLEVRCPREGPKYRTDDKGFTVVLAEPSADEQFAAAFRDWDATFDVDRLSPQEAAARLRGRPAAVQAEVISALDQWASERRWQGKPQPRWRRLTDLATALDNSANSRQGELRLLLAQGTLEQERALGMLALALRPVLVPFDAGLGRDRQRLRKLVDRTNVASEPVLGLFSLARALLSAGDDVLAERLLGAAVQARPHEVVLQHSLGQVRAQQGRWGEAVECHAAARALRPELGVHLAEALVKAGRLGEGLALFEHLTAERADSPWLCLVHGNVLSRLGRHKEAERAYRRASRLEPDDPVAHNNLGNTLSRLGRHEEAEAAYRQALRLKTDFPLAHFCLGNALSDQGRHKEAEAAYREAIRLERSFPPAYVNLGNALTCQARFKEAEAAYRQAIRLAPEHVRAHVNLGNALSCQGRHQEAEAACRLAIRRAPDFPQAHHALGNSLLGQGRYKEAETVFHAALRLRPDAHQAHSNLASTLNGQGRYKEAEAACRQALRLAPGDVVAHVNLGNALARQGRYKEAETACRAAIRLEPRNHQAHYHLGIAVFEQGRHEEAETAWREAIRLEPDFPKAHHILGLALFRQSRHKEAEVAFRAAIRLDPANPEARFNLGNALFGLASYKEAEAACRQAIRLRPDYAAAHCTLGQALIQQGRFGEALPSLRRGHALGSPRSDWPYPSAAWVRQCRRLVELDRLLPAVLSGAAEPAGARERLELAGLCQMPCKRLHATAARFAADAFPADPKRADDLQQQYRYYAACSAALAGAGQAEDARFLPDKVALKLRAQAYRWLQADLALYAKLAQQDDPKIKESVRQRMIYWRQDLTLASVRDTAARAGLDTDERQHWQKLWQEVDAVLRKVAPRK
jgi:tetratricopeptide (TPR) repeat protein